MHAMSQDRDGRRVRGIARGRVCGLADDVLGTLPSNPTEADHLGASLRAYELEYRASLVKVQFASLDGLISSTKALSKREAERRAGVFAMGLLLRFAAQRDLSDEEIGRAMRCFGGCSPPG